jgi:hypothetical protein
MCRKINFVEYARRGWGDEPHFFDSFIYIHEISLQTPSQVLSPQILLNTEF